MGNLDDFFAKKDRKKSKTVKKFSTADEIAKKMDDSTKKSDTKTKKESEEPQTPVRDEDEWKDFEEEKKDYTGLKIGHLLISEPEQSQNAADSDCVYHNSDGETTVNNDKVVGPWKKISETAPVVIEEKVEKPAPAKPTGGYVPPALRNQSSSNRTVNRNKSRAAPDIHNEEFFPTLSSSKNEVSNAWVRKKEGTFEEVKHGNRNVRSDQGGNAPLSLGNRFNTLADSS
ncbi:protein CDV3 homolog [Ctenocephalides felis]|uniref:protein CDV3 homolog n=1 Tax=Ctenocephalides felis TaxID=7515 RepID=UPI000E6E4FE9|nr:protein CDV3 homolog [Ctenocephalides felis]